MMWVLLAGLLVLWLVGAVAVSSAEGALSILAAMAAVVLAVQYWDRRHRPRY